MVTPGELALFGPFLEESFLDPELCERLAVEMRGVAAQPATVRVLSEGGVDPKIDEKRRRTQMAEVSDATVSLVENRLRTIKPALEEHFSMALGSLQTPQFLIYREGDFFRPHTDAAGDPGVGDQVAERRVSLVLFVNGGPRAYAGGELTFYGLIEQDRRVGVPLSAAPGLLVGFRSDTLHGVTPVTYGERYTIVTWMA